MVVSGGDKLDFAMAPEALNLTPPNGVVAPIGAFYETSPASTALVRQIAEIIARHGGAALIVDYGYDSRTGFGETLQAMKKHEYATVLDTPGEADLTAHVDFAALAQAARDGGAAAFGPVEQGELLSALGIVTRAERLAARERRGTRWTAHLGESPQIERQLARLTAPDQMGTLFKALAIMPNTARVPAGFV
jgi:NADH dehydrogenase [ubiquinone] 1 alpha subcomplex assembly factor 7